jgi:hypothetical protein
MAISATEDGMTYEYGISSFNAADGSWTRITASQIIYILDNSIPLQRAWANYVRDFVKRGEKYSNESGDVLSGAIDASRRIESMPGEDGFIKAWEGR